MWDTVFWVLVLGYVVPSSLVSLFIVAVAIAAARRNRDGGR